MTTNSELQSGGADSQQRMVRCPECQALKGHCVTCSRQTIEERAEKMMQYYDAWLRDTDHYRRLCARYREQVTMWQGKHELLRHENNALRRKLRRQTP